MTGGAMIGGPLTGGAQRWQPFSRQRGLGLLEVLLALTLLGVGVVAVALAQVAALRTGHRAEFVQRLTAAARSELDRQLQQPAGSGGGCLTTAAVWDEPGVRCYVERTRCALSGAALRCPTAGRPDAEIVRVMVEGPLGLRVRLVGLASPTGSWSAPWRGRP